MLGAVKYAGTHNKAGSMAGALAVRVSQLIAVPILIYPSYDHNDAATCQVDMEGVCTFQVPAAMGIGCRIVGGPK